MCSVSLERGTTSADAIMNDILDSHVNKFLGYHTSAPPVLHARAHALWRSSGKDKLIQHNYSEKRPCCFLTLPSVCPQTGALGHLMRNKEDSNVPWGSLLLSSDPQLLRAPVLSRSPTLAVCYEKLPPLFSHNSNR